MEELAIKISGEEIKLTIDPEIGTPAHSAFNSEESGRMRKESVTVLMDAIRMRMKHCLNSLKEHAGNCNFVAEEVVLWPEGHFSIAVYECMEKALLQKDPLKEWNQLAWEQAVRALFFHKEELVEKYGIELVSFAMNMASECSALYCYIHRK